MDVGPFDILGNLSPDAYGVFPAWSAPSAIGTAGLGVGTQAGAEMTDFLIVLNTQSVSLLSPPDIPRVHHEANTRSLAGNCRGFSLSWSCDFC